MRRPRTDTPRSTPRATPLEAFLAGGVGLALALAPLWLLATDETAHRSLLWALHWTGLGVTGLVTFVVVLAYTLHQTQARAAPLGPRWTAAAMLMGLGAALEATALLGALGHVIAGREPWLPLVGVALALAAALGAGLVLETPRAPPRATLTTGAIVAAAAAAFQPHWSVAIAAAPVLLVILLQAWARPHAHD